MLYIRGFGSSNRWTCYISSFPALKILHFRRFHGYLSTCRGDIPNGSTWCWYCHVQLRWRDWIDYYSVRHILGIYYKYHKCMENSNISDIRATKAYKLRWSLWDASPSSVDFSDFGCPRRSTIDCRKRSRRARSLERTGTVEISWDAFPWSSILYYHCLLLNLYLLYISRPETHPHSFYEKLNVTLRDWNCLLNFN